MQRTCILMAALAAWSAPTLAANKCTQPDGRVVYQDAPCVAAKAAERVNLTGAGAAQPDSSGAQFWRRVADSNTRTANVEQAIAAGRIIIGMTADEALRSWGQPHRVNSTVSATGRSEQWVYRRGRSAAQYVYVDNGVVRTVQTQE